MVLTSEQIDKQRVEISGTTGHQYLQPYLYNKKKYEFGQPIHNINKTFRTKFHQPYISHSSTTPS